MGMARMIRKNKILRNENLGLKVYHKTLQTIIEANPELANINKDAATKLLKRSNQKLIPPTTADEVAKKEPTEAPPKKRGRPKKVLTPEEEAAKAAKVPKKRGRPRKKKVEDQQNG